MNTETQFPKELFTIWNTCINEAIRKAKLASTIASVDEVNLIISELEKLKK